MDRLTYWSEIIKNEARINGLSETAAEWYDLAQKCINRLAEYEDTGITPEEIKNDIRVHTELWEEKYNKLKYAYDLQSDIIKSLEKSNQKLSDRVVKAEGLISNGEINGSHVNINHVGVFDNQKRN